MSCIARLRVVSGRIARSVPLVVAAALGSPVAAAVIFVDVDAPGPIHNGTSWTSAFRNLGPALAAAGSGDQVWVAAGTYRPTTTTDRTISFVLKNNVKVFGGFAGGETSLAQRDVDANVAVLSGDIGASPNDSDNSFHVVLAPAGLTTSAVLDGFLIRDGRANGSAAAGHADGAGLRLLSSPLIRNCTIANNVATDRGGGAFSLGAPAFIDCLICCNFASAGAGLAAETAGQFGPTLIGCEVSSNMASGVGGGGLSFVSGGNVALTNCNIRGNFVANGSDLIGQGGGVRCANTVMTMTNCTVTNNGAQQGGGIMTSTVTFMIVRNGILYHNEDLGGSVEDAQIHAPHAPSVIVDRCCIEGLTGTFGGQGNIGADPQLVLGNRLRAGSPCIDAGSVPSLPADTFDLDGDLDVAEPIPFDGAGQTRRVDDVVTADTGPGGAPVVDMGAFEFARPHTFFLVDADATGANNGLSWADAFTSVQAALVALGTSTDGEIWVAEGTYVPTTGSDRTISFALRAGTRLYGGFAGDESARRFRDPVAHPTILTGDIGAPGVTTDNSFHVVTASGVNIDAGSILDGFVITKGNSSLVGGTGGGLLIGDQAAPVIRNCRIMKNNAFTSAGGAHVTGGAAPQFVNCTVAANTARGGAGIDINGASGTVTNCTIVANGSALTGAGGLRVTAGTGTVSNSVLYGNSSAGQFGLAGQISVSNATVTVTNCDVEGWDGSLPGANSFDEDPGFVDQNGADDLMGTLDDDLRPASCSYLIDRGNSGLLPFDLDDVNEDAKTVNQRLPIDQQGGPRAINDPTIGGGGSLPVDIGAFEYPGDPAHSPDLNGDGDVGPADLAALLGAWGTEGCVAADLNGDREVGPADLAVLLGAWGTAG
ncbi:MAG: right-handed parallel beta-helix repeat-containing protein [Phycisphaerales bacterium]|nr:right-handed parallel beta-helix repeat-containing protein [Phycisphaerales bacterium]